MLIYTGHRSIRGKQFNDQYSANKEPLDYNFRKVAITLPKTVEAFIGF